MKKVIIYFLILLLSVCIGVFIYHNTGYVLISYKDWSFETSLWFFVLAIIFLFILIYFLLRITSRMLSLTSMLRLWINGIRKRRARNKTILGLYDLVEGNWRMAEKKLFSGAKYSDMPLINYLAAVFVAQKQSAFTRCDNYLFLAQQAEPSCKLAIGLAQAELSIANKQWERACANLQKLHKIQPKNPICLQLLVQVLLELKDWDNLKLFLPKIRKANILSTTDFDQLEFNIYHALMSRISWNEVPGYLQKNPKLVAIYVRNLLINNKAEKAEDILKMILRKNLDKDLLELYANLPSDNPIKKLARAEEAWLQNNNEDPALLLTLGRICKQQKLWGKARQYFERSANLFSCSEVYFELGQICEIQHDLNKALEFYKKGIKNIG